MSCFVVLVPTILSGPAFATAVAAAGAALGLQAIEAAEALGQQAAQEDTTVEVGLPKNYALGETVDEGDDIVLEGNGFKVTFTKTGRGDHRMCVVGRGKTDQELERLGRDLLNRVSQQYAYEKITKELKKRGFTLAQEKVEADQTIRLVVRK
ncbi:MAG: DUF1257 domain-containing protein [Candidatus Riflebacteria bacterium]|nr:DUF1257 domain-containing protein [Candidatus Riflebacteria bacterium]